MVGTGRIAKRFMTEAPCVNGVAVVSVFNPQKEEGELFAAVHNIHSCADSYEDFLNEYIASPHLTHYEYTKRALLAGKHVLCEIPFMLSGQEDFFCAVMVSISGFMSSPFFAVYGASKAALKIFIESLNVELLKSGTTNRILNVSPGSLKSTRFEGAKNDLSLTLPFAGELITHMMNKEDLFITHYEETFKEVLARYAADFRAEGAHSYNYKLNSGRLK